MSGNQRTPKILLPGWLTIGLHHQNSLPAVIRCVKSDVGQRFLEQCRKLRLEIEYELKTDSTGHCETWTQSLKSLISHTITR